MNLKDILLHLHLNNRIPHGGFLKLVWKLLSGNDWQVKGQGVPLCLPVSLTVYIASSESNGFRMNSDAKIVFLNHADVWWSIETQAPKNAKVSKLAQLDCLSVRVCYTFKTHRLKGILSKALKFAGLRSSRSIYTCKPVCAWRRARTHAHLYFLFILSQLISERRIWDCVSQKVLTARMTQEMQSFQQHNGNDAGRRVWARACIHQTGLGFGVAHQATGLVLWDKTVNVSHRNLEKMTAGWRAVLDEEFISFDCLFGFIVT